MPQRKGQEDNLRHQDIEPGKDIENVRDTFIPHDDGEGTDLVEQRDSLLSSDDAALEEEEEKDRR